MKTLITFFIGVAIGVVSCGALGYHYITSQISDNMSAIIDSVMTQQFGSGDQIGGAQGQTSEFIRAQTDSIKEQVKEQLRSYLTKKVDGLLQ